VAGTGRPAREHPPAGGGGKGDPAGRAIPVVAAAATKGSIDVYLNALGT